MGKRRGGEEERKERGMKEEEGRKGKRQAPKHSGLEQPLSGSVHPPMNGAKNHLDLDCPAALTEHRLVTDTQTDNEPQPIPCRASNKCKLIADITSFVYSSYTGTSSGA